MIFSFQNCESPSIVGFDDNPDLRCLALAMPSMGLRYNFADSIPEIVEIQINGELVYSDCGYDNLNWQAFREVNTLHLMGEFEQNEELYDIMDIIVSTKSSCDSQQDQVLLAFTEIPEYKNNSICGESALSFYAEYFID